MQVERVETGGWTPPKLVQPSPLFMWPLRPLAVLKWLFGFSGYLLPWNIFYAGTALIVWVYLYPGMGEMKTFELGWIARILLINIVLVAALGSALQFWLYIRRGQGTDFKYNKRWPRENSTFLFRNQHIDNVIWTLCSGVPVMTAYMVVTLWAMANGWIPYVEWADHPIYLGLVMLAVQLFRDVHFYCVHRLIHWPPLYRFHKLHHKNTNPGPFSGLAMHPVEHVIYFSSVLIHWIVPSNPLLVTYHLLAASLGPLRDHTGFSKISIGGKVRVAASSYLHYLHHRFFEVNYGDGMVPLDQWFGTWHDGTRKAHEAMAIRLKERKMQPPEAAH